MKINNLVLVHELGKEILDSENMKREKRFLQHGNISTYDHSIGVAAMSLALVNILRTKVDKVSLVRGALLHDFFLYDWHDKTAMPKAHAYLHPLIAFDNAKKEFKLNAIEKISIVMPKYKESWIVVIADKVCTVSEVASNIKLRLVASLLKNNNLIM